MLSRVVTAIQNSARVQQSVGRFTSASADDPLSPSTSTFSTQPRPSHPKPKPPRILIANPRLNFDLSGNDPNQLRISNLERMAICRFTPSSRPSLFPLSPATGHSRSNTLFLIVTPRLESPTTPTKQAANAIPNRYKTPFFAPLSHSSLITRLVLRRPRADQGPLLPQPPGKL